MKINFPVKKNYSILQKDNFINIYWAEFSWCNIKMEYKDL